MGDRPGAARAVPRAGRLHRTLGFGGVGLNMAVRPFGKESSQGPALRCAAPRRYVAPLRRAAFMHTPPPPLPLPPSPSSRDGRGRNAPRAPYAYITRREWGSPPASPPGVPRDRLPDQRRKSAFPHKRELNRKNTTTTAPRQRSHYAFSPSAV